MASFGEILNYFKTAEAAESIAPLVEDSQLRQSIMAWPSVVIEYETLADCTFQDESSQWRWLWEQISYEEREFAIVAGIPPSQAAQTIKRLAGLRLIYPDGTVNLLARQYLRSIIMAKLKTPQRGRPKESKEL